MPGSVEYSADMFGQRARNPDDPCFGPASGTVAGGNVGTGRRCTVQPNTLCVLEQAAQWQVPGEPADQEPDKKTKIGAVPLENRRLLGRVAQTRSIPAFF